MPNSPPQHALLNEPDFRLNAKALSQGFLLRIRMQRPARSEKVCYATFQANTGEIRPITPPEKAKRLKKSIFLENYCFSPQGRNPANLQQIHVNTPNGSKLTTQSVLASLMSPQGNHRHDILQLKQENSAGSNAIHCDLTDMEAFLKRESESKGRGHLSEFRGGAIILTPRDVLHRACKNKKTGGHRSLTAQPRQVMNKKSAADIACEGEFFNKTCNRWEWGHLFPAGGSPQGAEVNLDPYNFLAMPASLNTWQMVPEMIARHLAALGFKVNYTISASAEPTHEGKFGFVANEIYISISLIEKKGHLKAEFFTTRKTHVKPCIFDAMVILNEFYKLAEKPIPADLAQKFQEDLTKTLDEMQKVAPKEHFESPEKVQQPVQYPYVAYHPVLRFSPSQSIRPDFDKVISKKEKQAKRKQAEQALEAEMPDLPISPKKIKK